MKNCTFLFLALLSLIIISCKPSAPATTEADANSFGEGVSNPEDAIAYSEVAGQLDSLDSVNVVIKARVIDVCQTKGCWMNIVDPVAGSTDTLFVQFKDYGFFMPKDLAGKEVVMQGQAYTEETSVADLQHFAKDAGKSDEEIAAITEPVVEKKFMASGVVILK